MPLTRTVNISLLEQTPQVRTLRFMPDLTPVDTDVLLARRYKVVTDDNGEASVDLPVKTSGAIRYEYEIPRDSGKSTGEFYLAAGSAIDLSELIALSIGAPDQVDLLDIADINHTTANVIASTGSGWVGKTWAQLKVLLSLNNVTNTPDVDKPVSTAQQAALDLKANLASPALTENPTAPTQAAGNNSTRIANTAFVSTAVADLIASSPSTLDTLNELAAALGNDPNFATTVATTVGSRLAKASNLSDLTDADAALTNLGLTANGRSLVKAANYSGMRTLLGLNNVDNTPDASKPVSTAQQTALDLKAPLANPSLSGTVTLGSSEIDPGRIEFSHDTGDPTKGPFVIEHSWGGGNAHCFYGYNIGPAFEQLNPADPAFCWGIEADYDDGTGENKMEMYGHCQKDAVDYGRWIYTQINKDTGRITGTTLAGGVTFGLELCIDEGTGTDREKIVGKTKLFIEQDQITSHVPLIVDGPTTALLRLAGSGNTPSQIDCYSRDGSNLNARIQMDLETGNLGGQLSFWTSPAGTGVVAKRLSIHETGIAEFFGGITPASMADSAAAVDTIYYSITAGKLVYKNSAGVVNALY